MGWEFKARKAFFEIPKEYLAIGQPKEFNGASCDGIEYCSLAKTRQGWAGQYLTLKQIYGPGKVKVSQNSWAFYLEDTMKFDRLTLRPGLRFSWDDYMHKKTISPRFSGSYDIFGDDSTVLSFGRNRYYGRNIFAYRLNDGKFQLVTFTRRDQPTDDFVPYDTGKSTTKFSSLKIPYDDEFSLGIKQQISDFELRFKYVKRKGRDQVVRNTAKNLGLECGEGYNKDSHCYFYTNNGKSDTRRYDITFKNLKPLDLWGTKHDFELSYERFKTKTNADNYTISENLIDKEVYYKNTILPYGALPVVDYTSPWTIRLTTISKIPSPNLTISNFFSYKGSSNAIVQNGNIKINKKEYDLYQDITMGKRFTWDTRINYTYKLPKNMNAFINLDVNNVLNKSKKATIASSTSKTTIYESGREFWLEVGIKW